MLRVKQDPSFAPSTTESSDHIIFNPPPSAPDVYHTPLKFLPPSDPRRILHTQTSAPTASDEPSSILASIAARKAKTEPKAKELTPIRPLYEKKYHLTQHEIDEIKRLRTEDPKHWTRRRLAEKFDCSQFFVSLCVTAPEAAIQREKELEEVKDKWGRRKREAREARSERKKLWGMDPA
jgi:hypothetical protein